MIAEVIINSTAKSLNKTFDYIIPKDLAIEVGSRIIVPFGRGKKLEEGYVIAIKGASRFATKEILKVQEEYKLSEEKIRLSLSIAESYFCNVSDVMRLMLPPGVIANKVKEKTESFVYLKKEYEEIEFDIEEGNLKSEKQIRILNILNENESITIGELELLADVNRGIIKTLEKNDYISVAKEAVKRNPFAHKEIKRDSKLILTKEQTEAFNEVDYNIKKEKFEEYLVYGVTGSRKN